MVNLAPASCEQDIFRALGLEYREPTERDCEVKVRPEAASAAGELEAGVPACRPWEQLGEVKGPPPRSGKAVAVD